MAIDDPHENIGRSIRKRGRKPREKVYSIVGDEPGLKAVNVNENSADNIIMFLPISSSDERFKVLCDLSTDGEGEFKYDPSVGSDPVPFSLSESMYAGFSIDTDGVTHADSIQTNIFRTDSIRKLQTLQEDGQNVFQDEKNNRIVRHVSTDVPEEFQIENENHHPHPPGPLIGHHDDRSTSRICCWWCCHTFSTNPVCLPLKVNKDKFEMYGHFCSFNCACAYLFNTPEYRDQIWTIYSLLNFLFRKMHSVVGEIKIRPAPPRQDLQMFGGCLTIDEFRHRNLNNDKQFKLLIPPMTFAFPQVEEIRYETKIPVDRAKIHNAEESLKLKRNKPILDTNHTLDSFLNITKISL